MKKKNKCTLYIQSNRKMVKDTSQSHSDPTHLLEKLLKSNLKSAEATAQVDNATGFSSKRRMLYFECEGGIECAHISN